AGAPGRRAIAPTEFRDIVGQPLRSVGSDGREVADLLRKRNTGFVIETHWRRETPVLPIGGAVRSQVNLVTTNTIGRQRDTTRERAASAVDKNFHRSGRPCRAAVVGGFRRQTVITRWNAVPGKAVGT